MNRIRDYTFFIIAILAVLFLFGGYLLLNDKNKLIETTQKELSGLNTQRALLRFMIAMQNNRGTSAPELGKDIYFKKLNEDSKAMLKTVTPEIDVILSKAGFDDLINQHWNKLKETQTITPPNSDTFFEEQTNHIHQTIELMRNVGDASTLILDPEMASYYLMDIIINLIPQSIEYIAYNRGNITKALAAQPVIPKHVLDKTADNLAQLDLLQKSLVRGAAIIQRHKTHTKAFGPSEYDFIAAHTFYHALMANALRTPMDPKLFFAHSSEAINAYIFIFKTSADLLEELLDNRIQENKDGRTITILFLLLIYTSLVMISHFALRNYVQKQEVMAAKNLTKVLEQLEKTNTELEHFAYVASHDLKEPLRTVASFAKIIEQKYHASLDATGKQYLTIMIEASMRMQRMISDLLDYSRINHEMTRPTDFDCEVELKAVLDHLQQPMRETLADITWDRMPVITHHASQFSRIMQNLISNALKYRREGIIPHIHIGFSENADVWQFSIKDNGIGINKDYFEKIFEPFKRLHTQQQYEGTGIGLAICKKMVERMGGKMWVESNGAEGSIFYFTLLKNNTTPPRHPGSPFPPNL